MQYSVRFDGLIETEENLYIVVDRLKAEIADIKDCITVLKRLSYLDAVITALERERKNMLEQLQKLLFMLQSLIRIYYVYEKMEAGVIDELEYGYKRFEINEGRQLTIQTNLYTVEYTLYSNSTSLVTAAASMEVTDETSGESDAYITVQMSQ